MTCTHGVTTPPRYFILEIFQKIFYFFFGKWRLRNHTTKFKGSDSLCKCFQNGDIGFLIYKYTNSLHDFANLSACSSELNNCIRNGALQRIKFVNKITFHKQLIWIASRSPDLKSIETSTVLFNGVNDETLTIISRMCKKLEKISLFENKSVTETGIAELARQSPHLAVLALAKISLSRNGLSLIAPIMTNLLSLDVMNCVNVNDSDLCALGEFCKKLTYLDISHCSAVSDAGIIGIASNCVNLASLMAIKCSKVSDLSCLHIAQSCKALKEICLSRTSVTDEGIILLAHNLSSLCLVDVTHNDFISDTSITEVITNSKELSVLRVSWCIGVSDESIALLPLYCPHMSQLYVRDCFRVTEVSLGPLRAASPGCDIYDF